MRPEDDTSDSESPAPIETAAAERTRVRASTRIFAIATMFSRVAGMVRNMVTAAIFGVSPAISAFTIAFQIPNLVRALVADSALSAAFVPVFSELRQEGDEHRAWRLATSLAALIVVVLGPLCMLLMFFAPEVIQPFISRGSFTPAQIDLAVRLTRILMPIVVLFALSGLVVGILNAHDHFSSPAFAPIAWNFIIIGSLVGAAAVASGPDRIYIYTAGTLVGTIVQFAIPLPWLRSIGRPPRGALRVTWRDPKVREVLVLMLPVTIGLGLINLQQLIDSAISTRVPHHLFPHGVSVAGGPAILENAFRLYMLPQGVFSVGISTVVFPALARHAARGDMERYRETFADGLRQILIALLPASALLLVLAQPIVRLLMQYHAFHAHDTLIVGHTLAALALGLTLNGASLLLIRAFFGLKQPWLPTAVSLLTLAVNVVGDLALYRVLGVPGIALATSIVNIVAFGVLYVLLQRRVGLLGSRGTLRVAVLALAASAASAALAWGTWWLVDRWLGTGIAGRILGVLLGSCVAAGAYLTMIRRMRLVGPGFLRGLAGRGTRRSPRQ